VSPNACLMRDEPGTRNVHQECRRLHTDSAIKCSPLKNFAIFKITIASYYMKFYMLVTHSITSQILKLLWHYLQH